MTPEAVRQSVEMLDLLLIALGRVTEKHHSSCPCHHCTAAMGAGIAHTHLLALLDNHQTPEGNA